MNGLYSNFEKLGHKYGLAQLSLSYDTPKSAHDDFFWRHQIFIFWRWGTPQRGFPTLQKNHGSSFYPVLEINWADMEKDEENYFWR